MHTITSTQEFEAIISDNLAVLVYFSHDRCSVCKTLKPKINDHFSAHFPEMKRIYVNTENNPEIVGKYSIFTVPVILVFFEGRETYRKARSIGVLELAELVDRPYSMIFS